LEGFYIKIWRISTQTIPGERIQNLNPEDKVSTNPGEEHSILYSLEKPTQP